MVLGFLGTFQSAGTRRVMELKIYWHKNTRKEEEIRNLVSHVKDIGGQVEVVEVAKKVSTRSDTNFPWKDTLKLEKGSAVCVLINVFCCNMISTEWYEVTCVSRERK